MGQGMVQVTDSKDVRLSALKKEFDAEKFRLIVRVRL
jgi:hypothetical protein